MVFTFKLQKILDLKLKMEDEKKNQIASLMQSLRNKEDELGVALNEKKLKAKILGNVKAEKSLLLRIVPMFIKKYIIYKIF